MFLPSHQASKDDLAEKLFPRICGGKGHIWKALLICCDKVFLVWIIELFICMLFEDVDGEIQAVTQGGQVHVSDKGGPQERIGITLRHTATPQQLVVVKLMAIRWECASRPLIVVLTINAVRISFLLRRTFLLGVMLLVFQCCNPLLQTGVKRMLRHVTSLSSEKRTPSLTPFLFRSICKCPLLFHPLLCPFFHDPFLFPSLLSSLHLLV